MANQQQMLDELYNIPAQKSKAKRIAEKPTLSQVLHGTLAGAGMFPLAGNIADVADAGLYAMEGNKADAALSLAAAVPGMGLGARVVQKGKKLKAGKATLDKFKAIKGKGDRDVVLVDMIDEKGKKFTQPMYKSSGSSVDAPGIDPSVRKGEWLPFMGRKAADGWFIKGQKVAADEFGELKNIDADKLKKLGYTKEDINNMRRVGDYGDISKEIKRLDKVGYFDKNVYDNLNPELMNKWLKEQGASSKALDLYNPQAVKKKSKKSMMDKVFNWVKDG